LKSCGLLRQGQQDPVSVFRFIAAQKAEHSIKTMWRVLEVSRSGYRAWAGRPPSTRAAHARRTERNLEIHQANRTVYGSPRIHAELRMADGIGVGRKRVERLMRQAGISGLIPRRRGKTTVSLLGVRVCEDLVDRAFLAAAPNRLWVADITHLRTWGLALPRRRLADLQPPDRRLGDGQRHAHRARARDAAAHSDL
jgi:putative transposase